LADGFGMRALDLLEDGKGGSGKINSVFCWHN